MQIKQRELLELKKRKLELELAATQKQLGLTPTTVAPQPIPVVPDPGRIVNMKEMAKHEPIAMSMMPIIPPKPLNVIAQPPFIPNQMPPTNVRTKIAPVNPSMVNSVRLRDPRLARQTPQNIAQPPTVPSHPMNDHHILPKVSSRTCSSSWKKKTIYLYIIKLIDPCE